MHGAARRGAQPSDSWQRSNSDIEQVFVDDRRGFWLVVSPDDWCGQWTAKDERDAA